jgi:hypothetical protein
MAPRRHHAGGSVDEAPCNWVLVNRELEIGLFDE